MKSKVEYYSGTYKNFSGDLYSQIRQETYGKDIGQNSWLTAGEYTELFSFLKLSPDKKVLEIATGSGGPAVFMVKETGCTLTGLEINQNGVTAANKLAAENGVSEQINFLAGDAAEPLPFPNESFDILICIDSINHLKDRNNVLKECRRVLKTGGKLLYIDPIVITGILTNEEIAIRSSIGFFLFVPLGENERLLSNTGFREIQSKDVTDNMAAVSIKYYNAREKRKEDLIQMEGENKFNDVQLFFNMVHILSSEKRLSRILFAAAK